MATIDTDGLNQLANKIKGPLKIMWEKLESKGVSEEFLQDFSYIHRFLDEVERWPRQSENVQGEIEPQIIVNGKVYKPVD